MPATFRTGTDWEQSSGPLIPFNVHEKDIWPISDNSRSGTKDELEPGHHPVVAIGERTAAFRGQLLTGVVYTVAENSINGDYDFIVVNIAPGMIIRDYVANVLTYVAGVPATFEQTPQPGQPVYVDDSDDIGEGVTLSMSPSNENGDDNPLAGYLTYCQDEMGDSFAGGPNEAPTFDTALANSLVEQVFCIVLTNATRDI